MIFVRLFALALLLHENNGFFNQGRGYFLTCFLPTFGLTLPPRGMMALHGSLIACAVVLLAAPSLWLLYPAVLVLLTVLIASYSLRLSNHLVVGWFFCLMLCLDLLFQAPDRRGLAPTAFFLSGAQIIVGLTYALAFLHKLNPEYLSPEMSCGSFLGCGYLERRVLVRHPRLLKLQGFLSIYAILALEGGIPLLLLFPATRPFALLLAVLLHLPLALIGNAHFAGMMYAGLTVFVPPGQWPALLHSTLHGISGGRLALLLGLGLYLGHRFGVYNYKHRLPAYGHQLLFGIYFLAALLVCLTLLRGGPLPATFSWGGPAACGLLLLLTAAFLVNGLSPYLGLKTNFSLAMFSNLRPLPWHHLLWRAQWRPFRLDRYVQIESIEGLPTGEDALYSVLQKLEQPEQWLYSEYFFHEGLQRLCRTVSPPPVIRVIYTQSGQQFAVENYAEEAVARPPCYRRLGLFPYVLPRDPAARHCD